MSLKVDFEASSQSYCTLCSLRPDQKGRSQLLWFHDLQPLKTKRKSNEMLSFISCFGCDVLYQQYKVKNTLPSRKDSNCIDELSVGYSHNR